MSDDTGIGFGAKPEAETCYIIALVRSAVPIIADKIFFIMSILSW